MFLLSLIGVMMVVLKTSQEIDWQPCVCLLCIVITIFGPRSSGIHMFGCQKTQCLIERSDLTKDSTPPGYVILTVEGCGR